MIIEDWLLIFMALALVIVIWDVIRHRRMAKRIAEAQKMESIGRLAGGIAHDFNNMLAGISSAADFIKLKLGKNTNCTVMRRLLWILVYGHRI